MPHITRDPTKDECPRAVYEDEDLDCPKSSSVDLGPGFESDWTYRSEGLGQLKAGPDPLG